MIKLEKYIVDSQKANIMGHHGPVVKADCSLAGSPDSIPSAVRKKLIDPHYHTE